MIKRRYTFITISTVFRATKMFIRLGYKKLVSPVYINFTNLAIKILDNVRIIFRLFELWTLAIVVANAEISWVDPRRAQSEKNEASNQFSFRKFYFSYQKTAITSIEKGMYQSLKTGMTSTKV